MLRDELVQLVGHPEALRLPLLSKNICFHSGKSGDVHRIPESASLSIV